MNQVAQKVKQVFIEKFEATPHMYYSPGRINLIGEHVDYNDGFVLPAAIDKGIYFAIALNNSQQINIYSLFFDESISVSLSEVQKMDSWKNYVLGVVDEFQKLNLPVQGFNCVFDGNVPVGGGLSSSAALEGGISYSLNELCQFGLNRKELALLGQRAEHNFPNVKCGIMDQYANMMGKKNEVILLDCKNISHQYIPLNLEGYEIVLINSKVHHSLSSSAYNQRRIEGERGLAILKKHLSIQSFRELNDPSDLFPYKEEMGNDIYKRCLYIIQEINRTQEAASLLQQNNIKGFGKLMYETHEGLKNDYEVSCPELDFLVDNAKENSSVAGSRLMGGGFGGCTINIIQREGVAAFISKVLPAYKKHFNVDAEVYDVRVVNGTGSYIEA